MKYIFGFILCATLIGCSEQRAGDELPMRPIRVAVLPDQSEERLRGQYAPLMEYLESSTNLEFELSIPSDYSDLVEQFDAGHIDLAWFGGLTFVQAAERSQAVPLVFRDVDLRFTSCYLANATDDRTAIRDFADGRFSFGPELSTSGHLMPRYYMTREGLDPDAFFRSVRHSAGHDQTALWVSDGIVELAVANCVIVKSLFESGDLDESRVRVIETTPPYSDYVWSVTPSLDASTRIVILNAFLALDASIPGERVVLESQGANAYMPAGQSDFDLIRTAAVQAGVLRRTDD